MGSRYLNVSDGGHIENLGVYELLRRRRRYIIAIDGECDPDLVFPSLMRMQQFAAVDMDIRIDMNLGRLRWVEFPRPRTSGWTTAAWASTSPPTYSLTSF